MSDLKTSRKFHPIIAREGWLFIAISFICALLAQFWTRLAWAWPFWLVTLLLISVFMNLLNAHSQRAPVDGTVIKAEYFRGAFLNAALDKASSANERNAL